MLLIFALVLHFASIIILRRKNIHNCKNMDINSHMHVAEWLRHPASNLEERPVQVQILAEPHFHPIIYVCLDL